MHLLSPVQHGEFLGPRPRLPKMVIIPDTAVWLGQYFFFFFFNSQLSTISDLTLFYWPYWAVESIMGRVYNTQNVHFLDSFSFLFILPLSGNLYQ